MKPRRQQQRDVRRLPLSQLLGRLRTVSGVRQIDIAELLVAADNYSVTCADALILGTPKDQLNHEEKPKKHRGISPENVARMKQEMEVLERDLKTIETGYGENVLKLTLIPGLHPQTTERPRLGRVPAQRSSGHAYLPSGKSFDPGWQAEGLLTFGRLLIVTDISSLCLPSMFPTCHDITLRFLKMSVRATHNIFIVIPLKQVEYQLVA